MSAIQFSRKISVVNVSMMAWVESGEGFSTLDWVRSTNFWFGLDFKKVTPVQLCL